MLVVLIHGCAGPLPSAGCVDDGERVACAHQTTLVSDGIFDRELHWQVPDGEAPEGGWPVALGFQGSLLSAESNWQASTDTPFGGIHQARLTRDLLDAGYAVLTPEAWGDGATCWNTNVPPWAGDWDAAPDHLLMEAIFAGVEGGGFGALDASRLYAFGISSGGYMTSRMSDYGRFTALAVVAASWETCAGPLCVLPDVLPADHPPTLFLHGASDPIVPVDTMWAYHDALAAQGTEVWAVTEAEAGHEWTAGMPAEVVGAFEALAPR